ncbi:MAG: ATPase [Bacteroidales bacterium]|nr:ATPase [Bacteroidales bacterium]
MIAIADSGATKTDWAFINPKNEITHARTIGFNPYFIKTDGIREELKKNLFPYVNNQLVKEVYFYGAGCSTPINCDIVHSALEDFFLNAEIDVDHDLLGAARALLGKEKGIACILGTGSNSCSYNGSFITENVNSLGYVLADEGSGAYLGKQLIRDFFLNELPEDLKKAFDKKYNYSLENVLNAIYDRPYPNRFLASFSYFLSANLQHEHVRNLIRNAFRAFFKHQVTKYKGYSELPVRALGSVAWHYREFLVGTAMEFGINMDKILQNPIDGLIEYHRPFPSAGSDRNQSTT